VDEREGGDREIFDRSDPGQDARLQLASLDLVKPDEDRGVRPCGEIIALGSHQQGPDVSAASLIAARKSASRSSPNRFSGGRSMTISPT
jgi:hypothetical protein